MRNTQPERSLWTTIRTKNKNMIERLQKCRTKLNNSRWKKLPRALFQKRYAQRQNRQKISCMARDLRQVWYRPSSKMFMCIPYPQPEHGDLSADAAGSRIAPNPGAAGFCEERGRQTRHQPGYLQDFYALRGMGGALLSVRPRI